MTTPAKPTLLWDGECGFCARWVRRWQKATGEAVDYRTYQEALAEFPQVRAADCVKAVQLVLPNGAVLQGAHAVFQTLAFGGRARLMLWFYQRCRLFRLCSEAVYRFIAGNRSKF
jgi:predicted DCC family thiol-disulfide oxidoreductase YuxK